ncbi:MAG TPA: DUF456 domain-containing protein [Kineosporiaceae bacterium]|nr:DUF456 domain-containing protein [Kineosporiaceae bacterium]
MSTATAVAAVLIVVGLAGVLIPLLPGPILVWAGIGVWSFERSDATGWVVLAVATAILALGMIAKYALPGRRLREAGVPWITLAFGALLGVIGFFIIPVLGLPIGFILGVYLAEFNRLGSHEAAWPSTRQAVTAVGLSLLIEFGSGLLAAGVWLMAVIFA